MPTTLRIILALIIIIAPIVIFNKWVKKYNPENWEINDRLW